MKITIHSTDKLVYLDGVKCRVWEGETESGIKMHAFIPRVAVHDSLDSSQFENELLECRKPSEYIQALPLVLIL